MPFSAGSKLWFSESKYQNQSWTVRTSNQRAVECKVSAGQEVPEQNQEVREQNLVRAERLEPS
jgi:hypothetical protein